MNSVMFLTSIIVLLNSFVEFPAVPPTHSAANQFYFVVGYGKGTTGFNSSVSVQEKFVSEFVVFRSPQESDTDSILREHTKDNTSDAGEDDRNKLTDFIWQNVKVFLCCVVLGYFLGWLVYPCYSWFD